MKTTRRGFLRLAGIVAGALALRRLPFVSLVENDSDSGEPEAYTICGWFEYPPVGTDMREPVEELDWICLRADAISRDHAFKMLRGKIAQHPWRVGPCAIFACRLSEEECDALVAAQGKMFGIIDAVPILWSMDRSALSALEDEI